MTFAMTLDSDSCYDTIAPVNNLFITFVTKCVLSSVGARSGMMREHLKIVEQL
jgi:hypothetical protein